MSSTVVHSGGSVRVLVSVCPSVFRGFMSGPGLEVVL